MKTLLSAVALSALMTGAALAGEPVLLTSAQMDVVTAGGGRDNSCCTSTRVDVDLNRNNTAAFAGVIVQNSGDNSQNTNGGVYVSR